MDLTQLLEHVPPLLTACVAYEVNDEFSHHRVRAVRLVNKEASRVALLGLATYALRLAGGDSDTNVCGSRLLRGAASSNSVSISICQVSVLCCFPKVCHHNGLWGPYRKDKTRQDGQRMASLSVRHVGMTLGCSIFITAAT